MEKIMVKSVFLAFSRLSVADKLGFGTTEAVHKDRLIYIFQSCTNIL